MKLGESLLLQITTTTMEKKGSRDLPEAVRDEHVVQPGETHGRRESVAMNIIENPLRVSQPTCTSACAKGLFGDC